MPTQNRLFDPPRMKRPTVVHKSDKSGLGLFNNYVTLKLPFLEPPTPHHHASSRMTTKPTLCYVMPDTDTPLYHLFLFFEVEKKPQRYAPTYDTSTHVFKQLNQIVKFK